VSILPFSQRVDPWYRTSEKGEESSGRKASCRDPVPDGVELEKISPVRQENSLQA
jgi:hypothetical protein